LAALSKVTRLFDSTRRFANGLFGSLPDHPAAKRKALWSCGIGRERG
jgi:hypothetical protein